MRTESTAVSEADILRMIALRKSGLSVAQIARQMERGQSTVYTHLEGLFPKAKTGPHPKLSGTTQAPGDDVRVAFSEDETQRAVSMRRNGWSIGRIARSLGRSESAVYKSLLKVPEFEYMKLRGGDRAGATKEIIRGLFNRGTGIRGIMAAVGVSYNYVRRRLSDDERYCFQLRAPNFEPVTEFERGHMRAFRAAGMTTRQIGEKLNRSASTVRDHLNGRADKRVRRRNVKGEMPVGFRYVDYGQDDADRWREWRVRRAA